MLLWRYIRGGEASAQEEELMEQWLAEDGQREKELLQLASLYDVERTYKRILSRDPEAAFWKTEQRMQTKRCRLWMQQMIPVAACVASLVVLAGTWFFHREEAVEMSPQWVVREANAGMRTHFNLPDGTVVWLNSGSSVTYPEPYEKDHRRVELQGEAYFEVTPDPQKPFIVSVREDRMRIRVLGTAFNVQAYEEENLIHTTLVSGKVNLEIRDGQGRVLEQVLNPSEKASYDLVGGRMFIAPVNPVYETAWMDGKLMFRDTPLPDVLKRLSHFYNVRFEMQDPVLEEYRFTGTFIHRQLFEILDYLKISSNIHYQINQQTEDDSNGIKYTTVVLWKK